MEGDEEAHGEEESREEHPGVTLHRLLNSRGEQQNRTFLVKWSRSGFDGQNITYDGGDGQLNCQ